MEITYPGIFVTVCIAVYGPPTIVWIVQQIWDWWDGSIRKRFSAATLRKALKRPDYFSR